MKMIRNHGEILGQLVRFGLAGIALTLGVAAGYWLLATFLEVEPMLSLTLNYILFTGIGYLTHSRFSFKGYGSRDNEAVRTLRFFTVNGIGFLVNQFFVWLLVKQLDGPTWWPVIPIIFVTPLVTFALNRRWVFA
jgi:putative flippase GtrA